MGITIKVNGLSLCHRGSGGVSQATLPDVCLTPPVPAPVPYANVAYSKDLRRGTKSVDADSGYSVGHQPSEFSVSSGDEPGSAGGVTSGTFMKEATWLSFSMDVKFEGKGVCRHTDKMLHNCGNTMDAGGFDNPPVDHEAECATMWAQIEEETAPVVKEPDHQKRNKMITEKYASMYQRNPDFEWAGLAGVVSRQAGCSMAKAQDARDNWFAGGDKSLIKSGRAKDGYDALGEANRSIFGDIYPNHRFFELYGWNGIERCGDSTGHAVPEKLKEAFKKLEEAKTLTGKEKTRALREASDKIAEYEQQEVVQNAVYSVDRFKEVLTENEYWSSGVPGLVGWIADATQPQLALSAQCGVGKSILFEGSINNPDARVNFYHKLMDEWLMQRQTNPSAWSTMYDDIVSWSRTGG